MAVRYLPTTAMALDSTGVSLSGAKLNFYQTGTSTPLDTYSDNALSSANANPVVADTSGRFGDIFLKQQDYKVVLTDADDVTIDTHDPVHGGVSASELDTSAKSGSDAEIISGTSGSANEIVGWNSDGDLVTIELTGSATWDPDPIADGDEEAKEVTVTGAALGDFALASFSLDVQDLILDAQVTAADTVTCVLANNTGGSIDLASGTLKVKVLPAT